VTVDEHCRITIVGGNRQVDLAVPAEAPITDYVDTVARLCAAESNDTLPAAWSLGTVTEGPFAPERSLAELGIVDGQVLYLRDVIAAEYADPVVRDVGEQVAETVEGGLHHRWDAAARTITVTALGVGWLIASLVFLALRHQASTSALADVAVTAGLGLPALAWVAAERRWPVPSHLREALALSAVPILVFAAWMMIAAHWPAHSRALHAVLSETGLTAAGFTAAVTVGAALVGALLAYAATSGVTTCAVLFATAVAAVLCGVLAAARAGAVESASAVAVVAFLLLVAAPMTVSRMVPFASRRPRARLHADEEHADTDDDPVAAAVRAATTLLVVWGGGLAAVLAATLVPMAASRSPYAAAAAGCLGLAVLLRAGAARLVAEVVPAALAGAIGLFTLLLVGPGHLGWPGWTAKATIGIAAGLLIYGFRRLFRPGLARAVRPRWMTECSSLLGGISVALALATTGVLSRLVELGHHI
jgi:type VII secretion integral membrane protein EccD